MLASGDLAQARKALADLDSKRLQHDVAVVQWHYTGVAAARLNDLPAAIEAWKRAKQLEKDTATRFVQRYEHTLAAALTIQALTLLESSDRTAGLHVALEASQLFPESQNLTDIVMIESDRIARSAAISGDWATARQHWANALTASAIGTTDLTPPLFARPPLMVRSLAHNLALACEATGEWLEAANAWRMMLRTKPRKNSRDARGDQLTETHWAWLRKHVIACYRQAGDLAQAIVVCRQALKAQPDDIELKLDLVEALLSNEQMTSAMNELQKLVKKHPQHAEALARLAQLHASRGEWHAAEQTLLQALQGEPDNSKLRGHMADTLTDWGAYYNEQEKFNQAYELFERALTFAPTNYNIYLWMVRVDFNRRMPVPAREHLERALELGKNKGDAYVQAFECWVTEKDLVEARNILARADANGQLTVAVYIGAGAACLRHVTPANPPDPLDFLFGLAGKAKKPAAAPDEFTMLARELFDRAVALGPEIDVIHAIISTCGLSQFQVLLPYARRLAQLVPDDPASLVLLGTVLGLDQQVTEAQKVLREAVKLARKQGQNEVAQHADEMRKMIADPMFALALQAAPFMDALGGPGAPDDIDEFSELNGGDDDPSDFFNLFRPARRKGRKH
jgi:tetratricopeptide (TPR) repeat protein